jgi:hypothetical protein
MAENPYDPDERSGLGMKLEENQEDIVGDAETEVALPDIVSDPGLEGGVDAPNEEPEEH